MISKIEILQQSADILGFEHNLLESTLPPLIVDEYTVKGVKIPLIKPRQHDTATLQEVNQAIALELLTTSPNLLRQRYTQCCIECREHRTEDEYQELIEELCSTFDDAYSLIWEDLKNE